MSSEITGKSLTYVETDLDLYRLTQFEAAANGVAVANWSKPWNANTTLTGALDVALPTGRGARILNTVGNAQRAWRWSIPPDLEDASAVALLRALAAGTAINMGVLLRVSGAAGSETGYAARLDGTSFLFTRLAAGVVTTLQTSAFAVAEEENIFVRFDAITIAGPGVLLRAKVWRGEFDYEPSLFTFSFEDTAAPILTAGGAGLYAFATAADHVCGHFRVRSLFGDTVETLRYAISTDYLPPDIDAIPNVTSVALSPGVISLGENLGQRSTLTASFKDHRSADLGELFGRGSYWGKFRARQLFRRGQPLRIKRGLLGQTLAQMETRNYVLESFNGPGPQGTFSLLAKDVIKLAENDRAQAPRVSNGFLVAPITAAAPSLTLSPAGIGNFEYPASGFVAIGGDEICAFTRVADVLTLTRGQFGTIAADHDTEDRVQVCLYYNGDDPADIVSDLLTTYAGIDASYIPLATWQTETATYLQRLYTRLIAEPTGVNKLVSELVEQAGLAVWPDDLDNTIKLRVLRGIPTDAFVYGEENVLAGSLQTQEQPDTRITQIWTYYGVRNPLQSLEEPDNYRSTLATVDLETETLNGAAVIRKIFATWIPAFGRSTAQRVNDLQLGRFRIPPRKVSFDVMRYSGAQVPQLGAGYQVAFWGSQDESGAATNIPIQVVRINPTADRFQVEAEEMLFQQFDPADLINRSITIDSNTFDFDLRSVHDTIYPVPTDQDVIDGVNLVCVVAAGVIVGSTSATAPAFDVGSWPAGFPIELRIMGRVQGAGGQGGTQSGSANGQAGGVALYTRHAIDLETDGGELWGGGGGGGRGGNSGGLCTFPRGAGGGAGTEIGLAGSGAPTGSPGTSEAGGDGLSSSGACAASGDGGDPGQPGQSGSGSSNGSGGAAGAAIDGDSFVTDVGTPGSILGPRVN